jgi:hypothetical protein
MGITSNEETMLELRHILHFSVEFPHCRACICADSVHAREILEVLSFLREYLFQEWLD